MAVSCLVRGPRGVLQCAADLNLWVSAQAASFLASNRSGRTSLGFLFQTWGLLEVWTFAFLVFATSVPVPHKPPVVFLGVLKKGTLSLVFFEKRSAPFL